MAKLNKKINKDKLRYIVSIFSFCALLLISPALKAIVWTLINWYGGLNLYSYKGLQFSYQVVSLLHPQNLGFQRNPILMATPSASFIVGIPLFSPLSEMVPEGALSDDFTIQLDGQDEPLPERTRALTEKLLQLMRNGIPQVRRHFPDLRQSGLNAVNIASYFIMTTPPDQDNIEIFNISQAVKQHPSLQLLLSTFDLIYLDANSTPHLAAIPFFGGFFLIITADRISFVENSELVRLVHTMSHYFWIGWKLKEKQTNVSSNSKAETKTKPKPTFFPYVTALPDFFSPSMAFIHLFRQLDIAPHDFSRSRTMAAELVRWTLEEREQPAADCSYIK